MLIISDKKELKQYKNSINPKHSIGYVPTMGGLHEGHLSLMRLAKQENDIVFSSIYVNPLQFESHEDYNAYPQDPKRDLNLAEKMGINVLFLPNNELFLVDHEQDIVITSSLVRKYCGTTRPHHFEGVLKIIAIFLHLIGPNRLYLGEKDYQQLILIQKMVKQLNFMTEIRPCVTIREQNGLAMSSRNEYLSLEEKEKASLVYRGLQQVAQMSSERLLTIEDVKNILETFLKQQKQIKIDYISMVHPETLEEVQTSVQKTVLLIAFYIGRARLIDNIKLEITSL